MRPNGGDGIHCEHDGPGEILTNHFSGNIISGNVGDGVSLIGHTAGATFIGNLIGTDITGLMDIGRGRS